MQTITIDTHADLEVLAASADLKGSGTLDVLRALQTMYDDGVTVRINPAVLKDGYITNPAMLARNCNTRKYTYVRTTINDGWVIVKFTNNSLEGQSFLTQLKDFLITNGEDVQWEVPVESVPESYRIRPEQLRYFVKRACGLKLITKKTKTHWIFRRAKS